MCNKYGGNLPNAVGIPEEQLREAAKSKHLAENPSHFDPRQYLKPAREEMKKMYIHKIVNVLGSDGKAE